MEKRTNELGVIFEYDKEELNDSTIVVKGIKFHYKRDKIDIDSKEVKNIIKSITEEPNKLSQKEFVIVKDKDKGIYAY